MAATIYELESVYLALFVLIVHQLLLLQPSEASLDHSFVLLKF
jgi:hypothetical protein